MCCFPEKIKKCGNIPQKVFLFDLSQVMLFYFGPERFAVDPQNFSGLAPVPVMVPKDGLDVFFFHIFQGFEFPIGGTENG
jgi:hypothetical protein